MTECEVAVVVTRKALVADGVVALTLRAPDGAALPSWAAGAHVDVLVGQRKVRQYSLCGRPEDAGEWRIGVLREELGSGTSRFLHDELAEGDTVTVRGPRNNFGLEPSPRYLFVAGGIGITPLLPMIRAAEAGGADWRLVYGGRRRSSMAFLDELGAYGDRVLVRPFDEVGLIDLPGLLGMPEPATLVYCCGPEPLLTAVEGLCAAWPPGALHLEHFTPRAVGEPVRTVGFEVVLQDSGVTLTVPPDRSILSVVEEAGISVLSSCSEGTCGTCEIGVVEGVPDHRDCVLSEHEREANDCMLICVSRAIGARLVLEL